MLVACRLAGLSVLEAHYADDTAQAQSGVEEQWERPPPLTVCGHAQALRRYPSDVQRGRERQREQYRLRDQSLDANLLAGSGIAWTLGVSLMQPATRYNQYSEPCVRAARNSLAVMSTPVNAAATVPFTSTRCNRPFESR
jgi:hypothetical protein